MLGLNMDIYKIYRRPIANEQLESYKIVIPTEFGKMIKPFVYTGLHPCLQSYHRDAICYYQHRRCDMFVGGGVNHGIL